MNKYRNKKTVVDGINFDSALESRRYSFLKIMQQAGRITDLRMQVPFVLIGKFEDFQGNKYRETKYFADFTYKNAKGEYIVEDTKSEYVRKHDKTYAIKKKLLLSTHGGMLFYEVENPEDTRGIEI